MWWWYHGVSHGFDQHYMFQSTHEHASLKWHLSPPGFLPGSWLYPLHPGMEKYSEDGALRPMNCKMLPLLVQSCGVHKAASDSNPIMTVSRSNHDPITVISRYYHDPITTIPSQSYRDPITWAFQENCKMFQKSGIIKNALDSNPITILSRSYHDPIRILSRSYYDPITPSKWKNIIKKQCVSQSYHDPITTILSRSDRDPTTIRSRSYYIGFPRK